MSTLSQRGPNANAPAKLPGIQTSRISDANTRQAVDALREWVEVRLGSRGDAFERAVTQRDLSTLVDRIVALESLVGATDTTASSVSATVVADLSTLRRTLTALQEDLLSRTATLTTATQTLRNDLTAALTRLGLAEQQIIDLTTSLFDLFAARRNIYTAAQTTQVSVVGLFDNGVRLEAVPNGDQSTTFYLLATGDFEISAPSPMSDGTTYTIVVQQDDVGGRVPFFGAGFAFDGVPPTIGAAPGEVTIVTGVAVTGLVNGSLRQVLAAQARKGIDLTKVQSAGASTASGAALGRTLGPYTWQSVGSAAGVATATGVA